MYSNNHFPFISWEILLLRLIKMVLAQDRESRMVEKGKNGQDRTGPGADTWIINLMKGQYGF